MSEPNVRRIFVYPLTCKKSNGRLANNAPSANPSDSSFDILKFNRSKTITKILSELKYGAVNSRFSAMRSENRPDDNIAWPTRNRREADSNSPGRYLHINSLSLARIQR